MIKRLVSIIALSILAPLNEANAHELVIKQTAVGDNEVNIEIYDTEVYLKAHRLPAKNTTLHSIDGKQRKEIPLTENADSFSATIRHIDKAPLLVLARAEKIKCKKSKSANIYSQSGETCINTRQSYLAKSLINSVDSDNQSYNYQFGASLEIVLLDNPAGLKLGDYMRVKVLYDGTPVAAKLQATFDGYSDKEHGYVHRTKTATDGIAKIKLNNLGQWMIRSKLVNKKTSKEYDEEELSTSFTFFIKYRLR